MIYQTKRSDGLDIGNVGYGFDSIWVRFSSFLLALKPMLALEYSGLDGAFFFTCGRATFKTWNTNAGEGNYCIFCLRRSSHRGLAWRPIVIL